MSTEKHAMFRIQVLAEDVRGWCDQYWDTYGFDFDTETCNGIEGVLAWPYDDVTEDDLSDALTEAGIAYSVHYWTTAEVDRYFGIDASEAS